MAKIKIKTNNGFSEIATVDYVDTQILSSKGTPAESVANFLTITKNNTDIYYNGGAMRKVSVPTIHYGTSVPSDDIGQDGDLFIIIASPKIYFTIGGESYEADPDMTWEEWVNSSYNPNGLFVIDGSLREILKSGTNTYVAYKPDPNYNYQFVTAEDIVQALDYSLRK